VNHYIAASSQDATWARSIAFRYPTRFPWWEKRVGPQYWPKLSRDEFTAIRDCRALIALVDPTKPSYGLMHELGLARGLGTPCLIVAKWKPDVLPSWMFFLADPFWSLRTCAAVRTGLFSDGETNWHSYTLRHQRALIFDAIERNWDTFLPARNRARYVHQVEADRLEGTHEPAY
jgi:hypothetical protein